MARRDLKYDITQNLSKQLIKGVGTSKHDDKKLNREERSKASEELKKDGLNGKEYLRKLDEINHMKDKIYMDKTFEQYKNICKRFSDFVKDQAGTRRLSIEESRQYIQPYIDKMIAEGKSPAYQKKCLAAICKGTNSYMRDYRHEEVNYSEQLKNKLEKEYVHNKQYVDEKYKDTLDLNRCIGIRREELINLKIENIKFYPDRCEVFCPKAKGGKDNYNVIRDEKKIEVIKLYYDKAVERHDTHLLTKDMFNKDLDLHKERANNAKDEYKRIVEDMQKNPERRDYYKDLIKTEMKRKEKDYDYNKLDKPYVCRGKNAETLKELGRETEYDRVAVLMVSLFCLNHYREDVSVQHYLCK